MVECFGFTCRAAFLAAALMLLGLTGGSEARAAGTIVKAGIDFEPFSPAANTGTYLGAGGSGIDVGDRQSKVGLPTTTIGNTFFIDIFVDSVPVSGTEGIYGIGGELNWSGPLIVVGAVSDALPTLQYLSGSIASVLYDPFPDSSGSWRFDVFDDGSIVETGPGVVLRIQVQCTGTGPVPISLTDTVLGGGSQMAVLAKDSVTSAISPYTVTTEYEGWVYCNTTNGDVTDLQAQTVTVDAPASQSIGTPFDVAVDGVIGNNGPDDALNASAQLDLGLPSDCSAAGGNTRNFSALNIVVGDNYPIPTQIYSVTCTQPSNHSISATLSAAVFPPTTIDPLSANDTLVGSDVTGVTAVADLGGTAADVTGPATALAGVPFMVSGSATAGNDGPDGPLTFPLSLTLGMPAGCSTTSANPATPSVSPPVTGTALANASWSVTCTTATSGILTLDASAVVLHVTDGNPANDSSADASPITVAVDTDGDTVPDDSDNCPAAPNVGQANQDGDPYGDACETAPCVTITNYWVTPSDDGDCDGWSSTVTELTRGPESFIGTNTGAKCANTPLSNDEPTPDAWPVDFNDDQRANLVDVLQYVGKLNKFAPDPLYVQRLDLSADDRVTLVDVLKFIPFLNKSCVP